MKATYMGIDFEGTPDEMRELFRKGVGVEKTKRNLSKRKTNGRRHKKWRKSEEKKLKELNDQGKSIYSMAHELDRTKDAVRRRLSRIKTGN